MARSSGSDERSAGSHGKPFKNCARFRFVRAIADIDVDRLRLEQRLHHRAQRRQDAIEGIREN